jgi:organic radical activating enzyme
MKKLFLAVMLLAYVFISFSGCSYRAWYEGLREAERQNCYKIESAAERQELIPKQASIEL